MRHLFIVLFLVVIANLVTAQVGIDTLKSDIILRTYIESDNIPLNREVIYNVELRWQGDLNKYQIDEILDPALTNLTTRGSGSSNKVNTTDDGTTYSIKRISFYLTPLEIGMAYIDGVTIKYSDPVSGQDGSLISSRIGIKIVDPLPESGDSPLLLFFLYMSLIIIATGLSVYFYLKYKKRKEEERLAAQSEIHETIEEKYIRLLRETIQFETDNIKESLSDLSHLLTGYFSERYNFPAANLSTNRLLEILSEKDLPPETSERVKDFFARADMVKFAGEKVSKSEFHRLYDTVELVIENQSKRSIDES